MNALDDLEQAGFRDEEVRFVRALFSEHEPLDLHPKFPFHSLGGMLKDVGNTGITPHSLEWLVVLRELMVRTGLNTLSARLIRAVELIAFGESILPVGYDDEDWIKTDEAGIYRHRSMRRLTRDGVDGPIFIVDKIHYFATPNYSRWQGYGQMRLLRRDEFPYDPFTPRVHIYYEDTWDGHGSVDDRVASATVMADSTYSDAWLTIHRTAFLDDEYRRQKLLKELL